MSEDNVRSIFDEAVTRKLKAGKWPEPDMAIIADDEAPALEENALPKGWGKWIREEATACNVPSDYVAGGLPRRTPRSSPVGSSPGAIRL
jgi:hypothetical protein